MPRESQIEISLGLGRAMRELKDSRVLHCDSGHQWLECIRDCGKDTGATSETQFVMTD